MIFLHHLAYIASSGINIETNLPSRKYAQESIIDSRVVIKIDKSKILDNLYNYLLALVKSYCEIQKFESKKKNYPIRGKLMKFDELTFEFVTELQKFSSKSFDAEAINKIVDIMYLNESGNFPEAIEKIEAFLNNESKNNRNEFYDDIIREFFFHHICLKVITMVKLL